MTRPTEEQFEALEAFRAGDSLKITAFAGAGKTTTLTMLANSRTSRGAYLAFNRAIANEAKEKFPDTVDCRTTHSMAYHSVMSAHRFSGGQMNNTLTSPQLAELFDFKAKTFADRIRLDRVQQAHLTLRTVKQFCQSDAANIGPEHVPHYGRLLGLPEETMQEIRAWAVDSARSLWKDMANPRNGQIPLGHDGYLKLWAMGRPKLGFDFILLDEAQDTNPAVLGVLQDQDAQIVYVGDRHQQIYEWRGAINAMSRITDCEEVYLTQSFRFGPAIAEQAARILGTLGEKKKLRGNERIASRIATAGSTRTVLTRTNATVFTEALDALRADTKPHIVGGTDELKRLLHDVDHLQRSEIATSPEFFGFSNWAEVVAFSETEEGEDIRTFVQLVEQHGRGRMWAAILNAESNETSADFILSTAHKAKGREWPSVRLAPDFLGSRISTQNPSLESEVRLFYVAMTRAKDLLVVDPDMLATFTTGAWKNRQPEKNADIHVGRAATGPFATEQPRSRGQPAPTSETRHTVLTERLAPSAARNHPASAPQQTAETPLQPPLTPIGASQRPFSQTPAQPPLTPKPTFWKRVGRLFGGN